MAVRLEGFQGAPNQLAQRRLIALLNGQQVICLAKSVQAGQEGAQFVRRRVAQRLTGNGVHRGQCVFDAMLALVEQQFLRVLGA